MIKLCIFDLDGTLINSLNDLAAAVNYALDKNNFPIHPVIAYKDFIGNGIVVLIERATAKTNANENDRKKILADFNEYYNIHKTDTTAPYNYCVELLEELQRKGIYLAVNTNKPHRFAKDIVTKLYPNISFDIIFGKKDDIPTKPDPYATKYILDTLNIDKSECLYIGDSNVDVFTAQNANVHFCGVDWGFRGYEILKSLGAENIVYSPMEILKVIERYKY